MTAAAFDLDLPVHQRRIIVRYGDERVEGSVEMVELAWGLRPREPGGRPCNLVRGEGRTFPSHRCLVPASEFRFTCQGLRYSVALADGDWFYLAGIWRPASGNWPEAYAIVTVAANAEVARYQDRQMAVLRRQRRMEWLDLSSPADELLSALPRGTFRVARITPALQSRCHKPSPISVR